MAKSNMFSTNCVTSGIHPPGQMHNSALHSTSICSPPFQHFQCVTWPHVREMRAPSLSWHGPNHRSALQQLPLALFLQCMPTASCQFRRPHLDRCNTIQIRHTFHNPFLEPCCVCCALEAVHLHANRSPLWCVGLLVVLGELTVLP